jgi:hypothetical protein
MENLPMLGKQPMLKRLRRRLWHPDMYQWFALVQTIPTPEIDNLLTDLPRPLAIAIE